MGGSWAMFYLNFKTR